MLKGEALPQAFHQGPLQRMQISTWCLGEQALQHERPGSLEVLAPSREGI